MRTAGRAAVLLLLATAAAAARHHNSTTAISAFTAEDRDEEGYRYGGKFVPNFSSQPFKGKYLQCKQAGVHMHAQCWQHSTAYSSTTSRPFGLSQLTYSPSS